MAGRHKLHTGSVGLASKVFLVLAGVMYQTIENKVPGCFSGILMCFFSRRLSVSGTVSIG